MTKKYKMVSINYTNDCAKSPRCSFCYLRGAAFLDRLLEKSERPEWRWSFPKDIFDKIILNTEQISIAYNGLKLVELTSILGDCDRTQRNPGIILNITTNPQFLNAPVASLFKRFGVKMVTLSLDSEKCSVGEWIEAAKLLDARKIRIGANILMLDEMYSKVPDILGKIQKYCDQIHLLRPKFYKTKIPLKKRKKMVWLLKQKYKNLFIDECFRWEFTGKPCRRGKDFVSINADGTVSLCSFDIYGENKKNLKKCPYI